MYAQNTSLPNEKTLARYGALTLTNKRIVGEENVADLALGGFGRLLVRFFRFSASRISGTVTEIKLDKIDSIRLTLNRSNILLAVSNFLWFATIFLLILSWIIAPYQEIFEPAIKVVAFLLNLMTLGLLRDFIKPAMDSLLSLVAGSYELPVMAFVASIVFFAAYMLFKEIRLEIHSAKNFAFTNVIDFSVKGGMEEAQLFAKKARLAEAYYRR